MPGNTEKRQRRRKSGKGRLWDSQNRSVQKTSRANRHDRNGQWWNLGSGTILMLAFVVYLLVPKFREEIDELFSGTNKPGREG